MSTDGDFPNRGPTVLAVTTSTLAVATFFVVSRFISRIGIVKLVSLDDYFIILAWLIAVGLSISIDYACSKGLGRRDTNIDSAWITGLRRSEYAFSVLYNPALMITKTSILIFYLRLSRNTVKVLRIASYATLAIVNVAGTVLTFWSVFQCNPLDAVFDASDTHGSCIPLVTLYLASAPINIITDLAILVLPIPVLTGMRLPQKQKNILVCTFALGVFVAVVDVVRIYYLQQASVDDDGALSGDMGTIGYQLDFAWFASLSLMWSAVEVNVGIICACIPTLKPLVSRILPKLIHDHTLHSNNMSVSAPLPDDEQVECELPLSAKNRIHPLSHSAEGTSQKQEIGMTGFLTMPGMEPSVTRKIEEQDMGMMDFLTTPETGPSEMKRPQTAQTAQTAATDNTVYFGFVNMRRPRSMLKTRGIESLKYCTAVTILFFLWGFSYGLLNTLNAQVSAIAHSNTPDRDLDLQTAYFGGYLIGPLLVGQWVLKRAGFKSCFIAGLCIYGTGTLMFWPSAVLLSFPGFIISNVVVGFGLSILETAANPFLALCGPSQYAEARLLAAQGVQAIGSVVSPLLAQQVLFKNVKSTSLVDVQWTYLAIALLDVVLAMFFYYMPLPEASDDDLHLQSQPQLPINNLVIPPPKRHFGSYRIIYVTLVLGVATQFLYVGVQEAVSVYLESLLSSLVLDMSVLTLSTFYYALTGRGLFAIGRFLAAGLSLILKPRNILLLSFAGALVFSILVLTLHSSEANTIAGIAIMVMFFEGPMFPIIFVISMRGLGRGTKSAAAWLTSAVCGGAIIPWVIHGAQKQGIQYSYCVVVALFAAGLLFPMYMTVIPAVRDQVDPHQPERELETYNEGSVSAGLPDAYKVKEAVTPVRRLSKGFNRLMSNKKNLVDHGGSDLPSVEHRERRSWGSLSEA